jgi:hypothetical protein
MCLQLSQVEGSLEDVESALQEALQLDDEYVDRTWSWGGSSMLCKTKQGTAKQSSKKP